MDTKQNTIYAVKEMEETVKAPANNAENRLENRRSKTNLVTNESLAICEPEGSEVHSER